MRVITSFIFMAFLFISTAHAIAPEIKEQCEAKWGTNYSMLKYCVDQQVEALNQLERMSIDPEINDHCVAKWKTNYSMIQYCVELQTEAKKSLGY